MSQEHPIPWPDDRSGDVVEWDDPESTPPRRAGRSLSGLTRDPRLPLVPAGLGAAAAFASLVGEWLVMTVPNGGPEGATPLRVPVGVSDFGGFGTGYVVGLCGLVAAVALALRGTVAARRNARVAGLALAAAVFGLLVATAFALDEAGQRTLYYSVEDGVTVEQGRGLVMAFVACALLAAALHLAGRLDGPHAVVTAPDTEDPPADESEPTPGRSWRRRSGARRAAARDEELPPAPADLTVEPTAPFARPEPPR
jgi:hypothetical protein